MKWRVPPPPVRYGGYSGIGCEGDGAAGCSYAPEVGVSGSGGGGVGGRLGPFPNSYGGGSSGGLTVAVSAPDTNDPGEKWDISQLHGVDVNRARDMCD